jgi:hypothetical protein
MKLSKIPQKLFVFGLLVSISAFVNAGVITYGDQDGVGTFTYPQPPTTGATLEGLATDVITVSSVRVNNHSFPFSPEGDDFAGTDQIYVGSTQTGFHDGYSQFSGRINGPQVISLDYASLVPAGEIVETLTLGIAADDFQYLSFGQPYTAKINNQPVTALTNKLNSIDQTGPDTQFFSIGIDPSILAESQVLELSIDQGGTGGDGWAIDFLTVGVTTAVPEPATFFLLSLGGLFMRKNF